jgi:hypothetical protein
MYTLLMRLFSMRASIICSSGMSSITSRVLTAYVVYFNQARLQEAHHAADSRFES